MAVFVHPRGERTVALDVPASPAGGAEEQRFAWRFYVELTSRVALRGRVDARGLDHFRGEVLAESFDELDEALRAGRELAARYPWTGAVPPDNLGVLVLRFYQLVVHPFVLDWQAEFRHWWGENRSHGAPDVIQKNFPRLDELLEHWIALRRAVRGLASELQEAYGFPKLSAEEW